MKYTPRFTYTFTPASSTLDLSSNTGFNIKGLLAVINVTSNTLIYAQASAGLGYSALSGGNILTLQYNTASMNAGDLLNFIYDDGIPSSVDPDIVVTGTITATDAVVAAPAGTGAFVSGSSTAGSYVYVLCPGGDSSWNIQITGLTSGTLYFEGSLDSTTGVDGNWIALNGRQTGVVNTNLSNNASVNGMFRGNTSGVKYLRIRSVGTLSGTPAIVIRISTGTGAIFLNAGIPTGSDTIGNVNQAGNWTTRNTDSLGNNQFNFPAGFVRTTEEPIQIFYDPFDTTLDTVNNWATPTVGNGAVLASTTSGITSLGTGTTASGWSKLTSNASFRPTVPSWIGFSFALSLPDGAAPTANAYRFWGSGTIASTPTTAAPMTDAVGFEISTAGKMYAVVYAAGVRTQIADLSSSGTNTQPLDANMHRYIVYARTDKSYWYIDGLASTNLVATSNFQSPSIQTLPTSLLAVGGSTPPTSNTQIQCAGLAVWDTAKNFTQIADGTYPWRKATVTSSGAQKVSQPDITNIAQNLVMSANTTNNVSIVPSADGTTGVQVTGTWTGNIAFEATIDNVNWFAVNAISITPNPGSIYNGIAFGNGQWRISTGSYQGLRVRCNSVGTGTAVVSLASSAASSVISFSEGLPVGSNTIGNAKITDGSNIAAVINSVQTGTEYSLAVRPVEPDLIVSGTMSATDAVVAAPAGAGVFVTGASTSGSYVVSAPLPGGDAGAVVQLTGTFGSGTVYLEGSADSTTGTDGNWIVLHLRQAGVTATVVSIGATVAGLYIANITGFKYIRTRIVGATTPSVATVIRMSDAFSNIFLGGSLPAGTNTIGTANIQGSPGTSSTGSLTAAIASATGTTNTTAIIVAPVSTAGNATITFKGSLSGTYVFEISDDNGTTWYPTQASRTSDGLVSSTTGTITTAQAWNLALPGVTHVRVRCSVFTSAATVSIFPGGFLYAPSLPVIGDVPSGITDANNPHKIGGLAKIANPAAVADGQRVAATYDKQGKAIVVGAIRALKGRQITVISTTTETTIITAGAAGVFNDIYGLVLTNISATTAYVTIREATAGTIVLYMEVPANDTRGMMLPVDSAIPQTTAANNWTATLSAAVTSINITALYVQNL